MTEVEICGILKPDTSLTFFTACCDDGLARLAQGVPIIWEMETRTKDWLLPIVSASKTPVQKPVPGLDPRDTAGPGGNHRGR